MIQHKKKTGRKNRMPAKPTFDYLYYDLDMSAEEMAEKYQVKVTTIYNWATYYRKLEAAENH